jgi:hypothetical protein
VQLVCFGAGLCNFVEFGFAMMNELQPSEAHIAVSLMFVKPDPLCGKQRPLATRPFSF